MPDRRSVYVEWLDHVSGGVVGWKHKEEVEELTPVIIKSLGFVVAETSDYITLASHVSEEEEMDGDICIMKPAIIRLSDVAVTL